MEPLKAKKSSESGKSPLVTIAFKTTQQRKDNWQEQADFANMSLSSYLDLRLELVEENEDKFNASISELKKKLAFYENSRLLDFFKKLRGQHFNFIDANGNQIDLTVSTIADTFTLLIHSFKLEWTMLQQTFFPLGNNNNNSGNGLGKFLAVAFVLTVTVCIIHQLHKPASPALKQDDNQTIE